MRNIEKLQDYDEKSKRWNNKMPCFQAMKQNKWYDMIPNFMQRHNVNNNESLLINLNLKASNLA
jgi:hypothetical protein